MPISAIQKWPLKTSCRVWLGIRITFQLSFLDEPTYSLAEEIDYRTMPKVTHKHLGLEIAECSGQAKP
jgi:hypothetical protein